MKLIPLLFSFTSKNATKRVDNYKSIKHTHTHKYTVKKNTFISIFQLKYIAQNRMAGLIAFTLLIARRIKCFFWVRHPYVFHWTAIVESGKHIFHVFSVHGNLVATFGANLLVVVPKTDWAFYDHRGRHIWTFAVTTRSWFFCKNFRSAMLNLVIAF